MVWPSVSLIEGYVEYEMDNRMKRITLPRTKGV